MPTLKKVKDQLGTVIGFDIETKELKTERATTSIAQLETQITQMENALQKAKALLAKCRELQASAADEIEIIL